jgi:hypothetical protein
MFGAAGLILRGMNRLSGAAPREGFENKEVVCDVYAAEAILFLAILGIAVMVAARCGGGFREYFAAILEPYVYLVIRLVVPCPGGKN